MQSWLFPFVLKGVIVLWGFFVVVVLVVYFIFSCLCCVAWRILDQGLNSGPGSDSADREFLLLLFLTSYEELEAYIKAAWYNECQFQQPLASFSSCSIFVLPAFLFFSCWNIFKANPWNLVLLLLKGNHNINITPNKMRIIS